VRRFSVAALLLVLLVAVGAASFYLYARSWLYAPIPALTQTTVYEVPRGAGWKTTVNDLHARGLLSHPKELSLWLRYMRPGYTLKAGEYELQPGMSPVDVVELLRSGRVLMYSLTVVEGSTFAEFRRALAAHPKIDAANKELSVAALMSRLGMPDVHPEGRFFPDTYKFAKGTSDLEVLRMSAERMRRELEQAWDNRASDTPLRSADEALTLASIVEKETALASERPAIAGVFIQRLERGMRLQTDPTVIYGMGARFDGNIRKADLLRDTPYNTYTRAGLPPTPICLPGKEALQAAVRPERSGALFFVATGKGDGSHYFSRTLEEHNAAVQRYLRTLRQK
jgi:UPF0755 protein